MWERGEEVKEKKEKMEEKKGGSQVCENRQGNCFQQGDQLVVESGGRCNRENGIGGALVNFLEMIGRIRESVIPG